jgi:hypothetical protein
MAEVKNIYQREIDEVYFSNVSKLEQNLGISTKNFNPTKEFNTNPKSIAQELLGMKKAGYNLAKKYVLNNESKGIKTLEKELEKLENDAYKNEDLFLNLGLKYIPNKDNLETYLGLGEERFEKIKKNNNVDTIDIINAACYMFLLGAKEYLNGKDFKGENINTEITKYSTPW